MEPKTMQQYLSYGTFMVVLFALCLTVLPLSEAATPTIATTANPSSGVVGTVTKLTDCATLSGGFKPDRHDHLYSHGSWRSDYRH